MTQDWGRVAEFVRARRNRLGIKQAAAGVSSATWTKIENAKAESYKPFVLARIEQALDWPSGTIMAIAAGGSPPTTGDDIDLEDRVTRLEAEIARTNQRLDRVLRALEARER